MQQQRGGGAGSGDISPGNVRALGASRKKTTGGTGGGVARLGDDAEKGDAEGWRILADASVDWTTGGVGSGGGFEANGGMSSGGSSDAAVALAAEAQRCVVGLPPQDDHIRSTRSV